MSKNFDVTVCLQSEKGQEWIRKIRGERLQGIAEDTNRNSCLASSLAASFPGRNKCPGIHCSLIEQEERENSSARKERWRRGQSESQIGEEKWQACL